MTFSDAVVENTPKPVFAIGQPVFDGPYSTKIWRIYKEPRWLPRSRCWWYSITDIDGKNWEAPEDRLFEARINKKMMLKILKVV